MRIHVGFVAPSHGKVYLESSFSDDSDSITKARLNCPDEKWSYSLRGLTRNQFDILADDSAEVSKKSSIYSGYVADSLLQSLELF
jgi:hypothetical protein